MIQNVFSLVEKNDYPRLVFFVKDSVASSYLENSIFDLTSNMLYYNISYLEASVIL